MISLKNKVWEVDNVPISWIYPYYLSLSFEEFQIGEKVKSPFVEERTPSFSTYTNAKNQTKFKCFSTGKQGDHKNLVMHMFGLDYHSACRKIVRDYNDWVSNGGDVSKIELEIKEKFKVSNHKIRSWNISDKEYWYDQYFLGSKRLEWGLVKPLSWYELSRGNDSLLITREHLYGYFNRAGELVKIYQPMNLECKFMTIKDYIPGSEHTEGHKVLIICSSWKDALCLKNLGLKVDVRVPNSENTLFSEEQIKDFRKYYDFILVLFDNDSAGHKAALRYKERFDIDAVYINLEKIKDIADVIKEKRVNFSRDYFTIMIDKKINQLITY